MTAIGRGPGEHAIAYDDTPIELHAAEILAILEHDGATTFEALFAGQAERMQIIGRFLALLELIRARRVRAEQEKTFGTIYLFLLVEVEEAQTEETGPDGSGAVETGPVETGPVETGPLESGPVET